MRTTPPADPANRPPQPRTTRWPADNPSPPRQPPTPPPEWPGEPNDLRLEALRDLVAVQPGLVVVTVRVQRLGHVLRQVPSRPARLVDRGRAHRQIRQPLDVHEPVTPRVLDHRPGDELTDREVNVQTVPGLVPLRDPQVRERLAQAVSQGPEERRHVDAQLQRVVATRTPVGQRAKPVQPVGRAVPAHLRPRPPCSLGTRAFGILRRRPRHQGARGTLQLNDRSACLSGGRIQRQRPDRLAADKFCKRHGALRVRNRQGMSAPLEGGSQAAGP